MYRSSLTYSVNELEEEIFKNIVALYNLKSKKQLSYTIHKESFTDILKRMETQSGDSTLIMSGITVTKEREKRYDFSIPYLPIEIVLFSKKGTRITDFSELNVGYIEGSVEEKLAKDLKKKYNCSLFPYPDFLEKHNSLKANKTNVMIADNIALFVDHSIKIIHSLKSTKGWGIVYPKGSELKEMFDPIIRYYIKSAKFYELLYNEHGKAIADYFIKYVKNASVSGSVIKRQSKSVL